MSYDENLGCALVVAIVKMGTHTWIGNLQNT
jgi:hypothetical protein